MGTFRVQVGVGHPHGGDFLPVSALVDTGAAHSMMPASLLAQLGVTPLERLRFRVADGRRVEFDVADARFNVANRLRICPVIFGPEDRYLLGATTLEIFNLMVDPTSPDPRLVAIEELDL
ncbi:MAG: aspartyl protease family protein [Dehalococcoidia bacterium]|nr:aspartyl protease family protein [Dehalococcoidia bacterium]